MTAEVKKYAERRIIESGIRTVHGHYPEFKSKEHVDQWLNAYEALFEDCFEDDIESLIKVDPNVYRSLLDCLRKNKENVPIGLLKTKYQKSYGQLKNQLKDMTEEILQNVALSDLRIEKSQAERKYLEINKAIKDSGILRKVSRAVFTHQDEEQVFKYAGQLREVIHRNMKERECNNG